MQVAAAGRRVGFPGPVGDEQHPGRGRLLRLSDPAQLCRRGDHAHPARCSSAGAADVSPRPRRSSGRDAGSPEWRPRHLGCRSRASRGVRRVPGSGLATDHPVHRVRRTDQSLWAAREASYEGEIYQAREATLGTRPIQRPHPPIWVGGHHPAPYDEPHGSRMAGWQPAGRAPRRSPRRSRSSTPRWKMPAVTRPRSRSPNGSSSPCTNAARPPAQRSTAGSATSTTVRPATDQCGVFGTPEQVREQLEALAATGATHLLLNPVTRYPNNSRHSPNRRPPWH